MALPVARVHLAVANAALPGLLPTPPGTAILPAVCIPILPAKSPSKAKPGRADAVERWDAHKIRPGSPSSSSSSSSGSSPRSPGSSPRRASSCDRCDSNKRCPSSAAGRAPSLGKKLDSNSKRPVRHSSSAEFWDSHKKPRGHGDGDTTGRVGGKEAMEKLPQAIYAGPEPCILLISAFMVRAR